MLQLKLVHAAKCPQPPSDLCLFRPAMHFRFLHRTSLLSLNDDVLSLILQFVAPPDAMQLALTCHDAYALAMPRFLSEVVLGGTDPAVMSGPTQITQFSKYMLADKPSRLRRLRALHIREGAFISVSDRGRWFNDFSCVPVLADLLREAPHLRALSIHDLEQLLASQPILGDAIGKLPRLEDLSFFYIGKCTMDMLKRTTCRPHRLEFGMWKDGSARVEGDTESFATYAPSLQTINLWQCACLLESLGTDYVSHRVRSLGLGGRVPLLSRIAREFPNVRTIRFAAECSIEEEEPPAPAWQRLDHIETGTPLPYFACTVRRLELRYVLGRRLVRFSPAQVLARTIELLRQTRPVVLSCAVTDDHAEHAISHIVSVIPKLRYLELAIELPRCATAGVPDDWVHKFVTPLRTVPLVGLLLTVSPPSNTAMPRSEARLARTIVSLVPSLRYVGVGIVDHSLLDDDEYEMARAPGLRDVGTDGPAKTIDGKWFCVKEGPIGDEDSDGSDPLLESLSEGKGKALLSELRAKDRPERERLAAL